MFWDKPSVEMEVLSVKEQKMCIIYIKIGRVNGAMFEFKGDTEVGQKFLVSSMGI